MSKLRSLYYPAIQGTVLRRTLLIDAKFKIVTSCWAKKDERPSFFKDFKVPPRTIFLFSFLLAAIAGLIEHAGLLAYEL